MNDRTHTTMPRTLCKIGLQESSSDSSVKAVYRWKREVGREIGLQAEESHVLVLEMGMWVEMEMEMETECAYVC